MEQKQLWAVTLGKLFTELSDEAFSVVQDEWEYEHLVRHILSELLGRSDPRDDIWQ